MSGRLLWIQDYVARGEVRLAQVSTVLNLADIGTKPLAGHRLRALLCGLGMVNGSVANKVGVDEFARLRECNLIPSRVNRLVKAILQSAIFLGLEPMAVAGEKMNQ